MIGVIYVIQWFAFFVIYCFLGWCIETVIVSINKQKFINRGFLKGPFLPLYGFGAIVILLSTIYVKQNVFLVYLLGCIGATILEYLTGVMMESLFKMRYWDYSKKRFNVKGHICLKSTLFWGMLSVLLVYVVHPQISRTLFYVNEFFLMPIEVIVFLILFMDFITAFLNRFYGIKEKILKFPKIL